MCMHVHTTNKSIEQLIFIPILEYWNKFLTFRLYLQHRRHVSRVMTSTTRQSEMANISHATCQCLATFTPLKSKILIFFRDVISLLARVVILLSDTATQEVPMTNIWKKLSVHFLRYAIELLHVKNRTCHKWR